MVLQMKNHKLDPHRKYGSLQLDVYSNVKELKLARHFSTCDNCSSVACDWLHAVHLFFNHRKAQVFVKCLFSEEFAASAGIYSFHCDSQDTSSHEDGI